MKPDNYKNIEANKIHILLTGTYCSKNKGDAAMQQIFTQELQRLWPGATVSIATPFPVYDSPYYAPTQVTRSRRRNLPLATLHWLLLEVMNKFNLSTRHYPFCTEIQAMIDSDAIVDLSGDMLTEDYGPLVGYSHFLPLLQAQALNRPVLICAQSVGPFRKLAPLARRIFSRAKLVTVRESLSPALLDDLHQPGITPQLTADLAFMLKPAPLEQIDMICKNEGIPRKSRPRLGISVSALLSNHSNRHLSQNSNGKLSIFARALDQIIETRDLEILLVPHVFGPRPSADDRQTCRQLAQRMKHPALMIKEEYRPEEIKGIIASCDAFVGCRMHANIAALDSGVPVLAIGYSHKTRGILADFGLTDWVVSIDNLDLEIFTDRVIRLLDGAQAYREQLNAKLPEIRARSKENIRAVIRTIESSLRDRAE